MLFAQRQYYCQRIKHISMQIFPAKNIQKSKNFKLSKYIFLKKYTSLYSFILHTRAHISEISSNRKIRKKERTRQTYIYTYSQEFLSISLLYKYTHILCAKFYEWIYICIQQHPSHFHREKKKRKETLTFVSAQVLSDNYENEGEPVTAAAADKCGIMPKLRVVRHPWLICWDVRVSIYNTGTSERGRLANHVYTGLTILLCSLISGSAARWNWMYSVFNTHFLQQLIFYIITCE